MLNRLLLVACICIIFALILYFFYWNRFIAFVISQGIRILYWNQESSSVWVEIGSIHFSLLAGRILLKDFRYHSSNQTFKIVKAQIQWRYWIRRATSQQEFISMRGEDAQLCGRMRTCRIQFSLHGVEWFLYNRTAAYDNIIDQLEKAARPVSHSSSHFGFFGRFSRHNTSSQLYPTSLRMPSSLLHGITWLRKQMPSFNLQDLLPFGINIQTGAFILGNQSTPNLLVAEFRHAFGAYCNVPSRSKHDQYKHVLNLHFQSPRIHFVENDDFIDHMDLVGRLVHNRTEARHPHAYRVFARLWRQLGLESLVMGYFARRQSQRIARKSFPFTFPDLRNSEEETPVGIEFSSHEYAIDRKVLEADGLELTYYSDVVGDVPIATRSSSAAGVYDIGNGDTDPEWGFDLIIFGGFIRYGPWADRQRVALQHAFFPPTYCDHEVTQPLKAGDKRLWTALKIFVELRDETSLQIPFRESSKDWQWDGVVDVPYRPRRREAAFFNLTVRDRSSINYVLPMVVGPSGYETALEIHLDTISITSSLNDICLVKAESTRVHLTLPAPVRWNAERTWSVAAYLRQPTLYTLRDHITMLTDLGRDWTSGPPTHYQKFVPMLYAFRLELHHYEWNLYVNDHNIIDKPLIRDENALFTFRGPGLKTFITVPSNTFRPETTSVPFTLSAPKLMAHFSLPRWNTHALHSQKEGISLFKTQMLYIEGSYRYFAEVRDDHVEQLKLDIKFDEIVFRTFGWAIRYLLVLRENYFGSFTHFQTLSEYLSKRENNLPSGDPLKLKYRPGKANMFEVEIQLRAERSTLLLPTVLVGSSRHALDDKETLNNSVDLFVPDIQLQLRLHDYYMEMSFNFDRVIASIFHDEKGNLSPHKHEVFMIDGIDVVANRLFGPQPRTAVYVCIWEISFGDVRVSLTANQASILSAAGNAFSCNYVDLVNAPAHDFAVIPDPDATFYKVSVKAVEATWKAGQAALFVQFPKGLKFDRNDLGTNQYKRVTSLRLPCVFVKVLLTGATKPGVWLEAAEINSEMYIDIYTSPPNHHVSTRAQLAFIEEQDSLTGRASRILQQLSQTKDSKSQIRNSYRNGINIPGPSLPSRAFVQGRLSSNPRSGHSRTPSRPISSVDLSDTDAEERVSEADRDARLALTRTSTPVQQPYDDNVPMSSGDESDDADLTDGNSSEDDWSDFEDSPQGQEMASLLSFYSTTVRHYFSAVPNSWDTALFTLTRENASFMQINQPNLSEHVTLSTPTFPHSALFGVSPEEGLTTIFWKCRRVLFTFSPLALPSFVHLEEDLKSIVSHTEICVDSLLEVYTTKLTKNKVQTCTVLDVNIENFTLQAIQHIPMSKETPSDIPRTQSLSSPSNLDILSVLRISATAARFSGVFRDNLSMKSISFSEMAGAFYRSMDRRTLHLPHPRSPTFGFKCSSAYIKLVQSDLTANIGNLSFDMDHSGPELVTATCLSLAASMPSQLLHATRRIREDRQQRQQTVIITILKLSQDRNVIDPLSTIHPSYLVQSGIPHLLRTDIYYRFLYHLRNYLDKPVNQLVPAIDVEEFNALVETRLTRLDPDAGVPNYHDLFGTGLENLPSSSSHLMEVVTAHIDSLKIAVTAPSNGSSSELSVSDVAVNVRFKKQDLLQFNPGPSSASQTSLRSKAPKLVSKTVIIMSLGDIDLVVVPHLMSFAQQLLRVKSRLLGKAGENSLRKRPTVDGIDKKLTHTSVIGTVHRLRIRAAAENLVLVIGLNNLRTAVSLLRVHSKSVSVNGSILFEETYLQARSPSNPSTECEPEVLAALSFSNGTFNLVSRSDRTRLNLKLVFFINSVKVQVPRSALRLYRFVEEWRLDYLPGLEAALSILLSEYRALPRKPPRSPSTPSHSAIQVQGQVDHFGVSLHVMHGTWLLWEVRKSTVYVENLGSSPPIANHSFGLQVGSMVLNISAKPSVADAELVPSSRVKIVLPPLSVAGHSEGSRIHMLVLFEFMDLKVKPSHWDTLLAVQQKFGQDFNDLLTLMKETRQKSMPGDIPVVDKPRMEYIAQIRMQGFRIGLVGLSSTVLVDCQDIYGGFTSTEDWAWDIGLSDLALSLAPRVGNIQNAGFNRKQRSAFVVIDINLSGSSHPGSDKSIRLFISKIHAVMQPSAIGEFGDFMDSLQAEMFEQQERRVLELAAFKDKAQTILQTFDVNVRDVQLRKASWLDSLVISISIQNIGVAFPLIHDEELHIPSKKSKDSHAVRAFLFSIKALNFTASRGETGQATMSCLCFQFVPKFKQSSPEHFAAEKHQTRNCLLYPDMQAQLCTSTVGPMREVWIKADVSGFILDIDSTIPSYVFSLIDVYRQGKERVEKLSSISQKTPTTPTSIENANPALEKHYSAVPTSNVFSQLTFQSGKVRFYSASATSEFKNRTNFSQTLDMSDDQILDLGAEVFNLPVVSLWSEYRATPASQRLNKDSETEPSLLLFKSTVFSSHNTLRPTLLPFLTELISRIETRMRKVSAQYEVPLTMSPSLDKPMETDIVSSMKLSFSLRIDRSTLELTCRPDVNVVAGLNWESGGFVLNISPGARKVHFSGNVGGLTVGLKHGFLSEDCVKLDARNLIFSVSFMKAELHDGEFVNSVSIVLDTEFLGGVRFSRLQDILCFKAVWLDRIPVLNRQVGATETKTQPKSPEISQYTGLSTAILVRIRKIALEVDLGQSVTRLNLDLKQIISRTTFTDSCSEALLHIGDILISAHGNLSGRAHVPSFVFQTIRRSEESLWEDQGCCLLELRLTTGALVADFESDFQSILHYHAEALELVIFDDWSQTQLLVNDKTRPVHLLFTITCPEIVAAITIGTIPKLLSYLNKFQANVEVQRQGASRESQTFRVTRAPKPGNPLSAVGEAMLHSARNRFKEPGILVVRQHMRVRLGLLRLIVFPRTMRDSEIAQLVGNDIRARLDGLVVSDSPSSERELHLSFLSLVISRYNRVRPVRKQQNWFDRPEDNGREWLSALFKDTAEANIVGLPSMKMHMISEESEEHATRVLTYDFFSEFVRREGMKAFEDIYITLNMSLYAWLTVLRKNLTREMDQVKATDDWISPISSSGPVTPTLKVSSPRGRKKVEPLTLSSSINEHARSNSHPTSGNLLTLPLSPYSAKFASVEALQSPISTSNSPPLSSGSNLLASPIQFPSLSRETDISEDKSPVSPHLSKKKALVYKHRNRQIERLTMRQLGEATPDVMHPFFTKKAGFSLEDSLPQYVHEYATSPLEEILEVLLKVYSGQLLHGPHNQVDS